ncbi:MAG: AI-2E family transporter [Clostridia bacterium]|nr:AI-2E family transporter [Clostridia bacterium]
MNVIKKTMKEKKFINITLLIVTNAVILSILYHVVIHFNSIVSALAGILSTVLSAFAPLWIGILIAYILSPLVNLIDSRLMTRFFRNNPGNPKVNKRNSAIRNMLSIILTFVIVILIISLLVYGFSALIMGQFVNVSLLSYDGFSEMISSIMDYFNTYEKIIMEWASHLPEGVIADKLQGTVNMIINWLSNHFSAVALLNSVVAFFGSLVNVLLGLIVSIYLLKDREMFKKMCVDGAALILPRRTNTKIMTTLNDVNGVVSRFIRGALIDSMIIATLSSIALTVIGLDFSVFIGCFAGLCNIIPYFGPILGMIPAFLVGTLSGGITQGLLTIVIQVVLWLFDGNFLYPKVVGSSTGLHPLAVLIAVSVCGYFWGIVGMVIAVPIAGIINIFARKAINHLKAKRDADIAFSMLSDEETQEETNGEE